MMSGLDTSGGPAPILARAANRRGARLIATIGLLLALLLGLLATGGIRLAHAAGPELPDLIADPPDNIEPEVTSIEGHNVFLLRFNGYVHNKGPGALDFRGERSAPKVKGKSEAEVQAEVEKYKKKGESLPQQLENELAVPKMSLVQREYPKNLNGTISNTEEYLEREHVQVPSSGEMFYVNADGHHHWHLQHVARYSLWNDAKSAEVAPAEKVGFCLEDSQHVESQGPSNPVYSDKAPPFREFCRQFQPNATSVFEGISPGWRDVYDKGLALQWVDISNVLPGEYWLREDINPDKVVEESGSGEKTRYAEKPTTIPGFDAQPQSTATQVGEPATITLTSRDWSDSHTPRYTIVSNPSHGTLSGLSANHITYKPQAGFTGTDSFSFSASDPNSEFPRSPAVATVLIEVHPAGSTKTLLVGNTGIGFSREHEDQTTAGREEAFQFTAAASGTVEELELRTNGAPNPGVTGVQLGVFAENAGRPGEVLGRATVPGEPATNSWVRATGLATPVLAGTSYWLVALPLGGGELHYNDAQEGAGNVESVATGLTTLLPESSWEAWNNGPVGLQALGTIYKPPPPTITINGAQAELVTGTSDALSANVTGDSGAVEWSATGGSFPGGSTGSTTVYLAPTEAGSVTVTARLADDHSVTSQVTIKVIPAPAQTPLPEVPGTNTVTTQTTQTTGSSGSAAFQVSSPPPGLSRPRAMLVGRKLIMTTEATVAGRVRLSAYVAGHRIGTCVTPTPGGRQFTCRVTLARKSVHARIRIVASLRVGQLLLESALGAKRIPEMKMTPMGLLARSSSVAGKYWCSPSTLVATLDGSEE